MDEKLQNAISSLIEKSIVAVENGATFLEGQIPDYIMQLVMWHGWYSGILCGFGIAILIVSYIVNLKVWDKTVKFAEHDSEIWFPYGIGAIVGNLGILSVAADLINVTWLQILIAPKVWLVEYGMSLVK